MSITGPRIGITTAGIAMKNNKRLPQLNRSEDLLLAVEMQPGERDRSRATVKGTLGARVVGNDRQGRIARIVIDPPCECSVKRE